MSRFAVVHRSTGAARPPAAAAGHIAADDDKVLTRNDRGIFAGGLGSHDLHTDALTLAGNDFSRGTRLGAWIDSDP